MSGLISDPIPLQPDRSLADYPTPSHWTGQDWGGTTIYGATALADAIGPGRQTLDASQANQLYGIDGQLKFDAPVSEQVAQDRYQAKSDELVRTTEASLDSQSFWGKAGRLGAGFVAGALDPVNIAASFVPAVGEARMASFLGRAGLDASTVIGRTAIRAATGATHGMAGQAALEPLQWARAQSLDDDYGPVNVLTDLAFGAALGGGLHTAIGAAGGDDLAHAFAASREGKLAAGDLETREAALRTGLAQMMDDRPVEVQPVFDAELMRRDPTAGPTDDMQTRLQAAFANIQQRGDQAADAVRYALQEPPLPDTPEAVLAGAGMAPDATQTPLETPAGPGPLETSANEPIQGSARAPRTPKTLLQFVASKGGIRDETGELGAMDLDKAKTGFQPGFGPVVRARGMHPDNMRELAESAGFLKPTAEHETTSMRDLYDALEAEIKTGRDYGRPGEAMPDPEAELHARYLAEQAAHETPELGEEGLLDHFAELAARERPEDIASDGHHDAFDIPFDDIPTGHADAGGAPDAEAGGGAADAGRGETLPGAEGGGRGDPGAATTGERRSLGDDAGGQTVLPGAERISDKDFAERQMAGAKKAAAPQKPADEGLFDVAGRGQRDLLDPAVQAADAQAARADLFAKAWDAAAGCMGSH